MAAEVIVDGPWGALVLPPQPLATDAGALMTSIALKLREGGHAATPVRLQVRA
jgi:hypothetical protein